MMLVSLFAWWYGAGWASLAKRVGERVERVLEAFSVGSLLSTLFTPFRQISAGNVQGPFAAQVQAFGDRLFSRIFGAVIRSFLILAGVLGALLVALVGILQLLAWPLVPVLPFLGVLAAVMGWTLS